MSHSEVAEKLKDALDTLREGKPKDRSQEDRVYSVCISEMEKILVYFKDSVAEDGVGEPVN